MDRNGRINSDDHYIYYCGQESLRRNGVALVVNKRVQNAILGSNIQNDRMFWFISNTVIEVYAPATNAEKAEVDQFYEDQSRTNTKKRCPFHHRGLECKSRKSRDTWSNRQFGLGVLHEAEQRLTEIHQDNMLVIASILFQQHKRRLYTWKSLDDQY